MRQTPYPPTLPRLGQGRAAPGTTVGVERCFLSKPPSTVPLPLTCFGLQNWRMHRSALNSPPLSSLSLPHAQELLGWDFGVVLWDFKTDGWPPSHAAAGAMAGFMGFQNWRMAPGPDPKGFPRPKMSLELALAVLRLAPSLVLTHGWPLVPISKASPGPKCCWSWL